MKTGPKQNYCSASLILLAVLLVAGGRATGAEQQGSSAAVELKQLEDRVTVNIGGQTFTEYHFKNVPRPFCYPILAPGGVALTRNYPMRKMPGEETDHPHHRSLWYSHGSVNGHDFWSETKNAGKIEHREFLKLQSGTGSGALVARNDWVSADGNVICQDERELTFSSQTERTKETRILDFIITLIANKSDVVFGDTKEGTMAIRVAESMRVKGGLNQGHIRNSSGVLDGAAWGKRAQWCDYSGPVDGKIYGITIMDHSDNPRHPTWWHVRDYGLFAANPFGKHDFEGLKENPKAGDLVLRKGEKLTFRYRFIFHAGEGDPKTAQRWYQDFTP